MKRYLLATCLTLSLALIGQGAFAQGVTYSGDLLPGDSAISTGANASSPGVSAEVQMDFDMPDVVALAIFNTGGDVLSADGAPLLAGKYNAGLESDLVLNNIDDILNDIIKDGNEVDSSTNTDVLKIGGVAYSSTGSAVLTVTPLAAGGTTDLPTNSISVLFTNTAGDGTIDVAFNGSFTGAANTDFTGTSASITTGPVAMDNLDNRGTFLLYGDVIESSLTSADDIGLYQGSLTVTAVVN